MSAPPQAKEPHLLSLKVLRAARPSLVHSPTPYYESTSLGGAALRELDLNSVGSGDAADFGLSGVLQLPSTFGTIYLGETFSALLSLSNDLPVLPSSSSVALSPVLKVEMHTTGTGAGGGLKHLLKTITPLGDAESLSPGDSVEGLVSHEVKELGVHALVCTVTYAVRAAGEAGQGLSPQSATKLSRSFRKVYKFQVSNPLSVRTKAHSPNPLTATSSLSSTERNKVFLEVQIQNQGEHPLCFERLNFEPVPTFTASDINHLLPSPPPSTPPASPASLFSDTSSLLPPQAVRQYLYILSPLPSSPPALPGSSQPLGRLDIVWRTPHGEVGRLQTSMLGRRVPQPPAPIDLPSPAPTPIEKDAGPPPALPGSPARFAAGFEVPASPIRSPAPYRPSQLALGSPGSASPARQPSPRPITPLLPPISPLFPDATGLAFDLTVSSISPTLIARETPFEITFALSITSALPARRTIKVVAQHVQYHPSPLAPPPPSLPAPTAPRTSLDRPDPSFAGPILPRPLPSGPPQPVLPSREVVRIGSTIVEIGEVVLEPGECVEREFGMRFLAVASGLFGVGGMRVLLVESRGEGEKEEEGRERRATGVWERGVVGEVWVGSRVGKE